MYFESHYDIIATSLRSLSTITLKSCQAAAKYYNFLKFI